MQFIKWDLVLETRLCVCDLSEYSHGWNADCKDNKCKAFLLCEFSNALSKTHFLAQTVTKQCLEMCASMFLQSVLQFEDFLTYSTGKWSQSTVFTKPCVSLVIESSLGTFKETFKYFCYHFIRRESSSEPYLHDSLREGNIGEKKSDTNINIQPFLEAR